MVSTLHKVITVCFGKPLLYLMPKAINNPQELEDVDQEHRWRGNLQILVLHFSEQHRKVNQYLWKQAIIMFLQ